MSLNLRPPDLSVAYGFLPLKPCVISFTFRQQLVVTEQLSAQITQQRWEGERADRVGGERSRIFLTQKLMYTK